jgi:YVTN family beta-propeller protein
LDTGPGGSDHSLEGGRTLPFDADVAVEVEGTSAGTLWHNGSSETLEFARSGNQTEIRVPWSLSSVSQVRLLAYALDDDGQAWSVFPTTNPLAGPWPLAYSWTDPCSITDPSDGQPRGASVDMTLSSPQEPQVAWGPGNSLEYVVDLTSREARTVIGLQLVFSASAGLTFPTCGGGDTCLVDVPALAEGASSHVDVAGQLAANLGDLTTVRNHVALMQNGAVLADGSLSHRVDGQPPRVQVNLPPGNAVGRGLQIISGTSDDDGSGVREVMVVPAASVTGAALWTAEVPFPDIADGAVEPYTLTVQASDARGNLSEISQVTFHVDAAGPEVLDFTVPPTLSGYFAILPGTARDREPAGSLVTQVEVQLDALDSPWHPVSGPFAPDDDGIQAWTFVWDLSLEDNVRHQLRARAHDLVGNETQTGWEETTIDNVAPVISVTTVVSALLQAEFQAGVAGLGSDPVLAGTATDGAGVSSVMILIYAPDGQAYRLPAEWDGIHWQYLPGPEINQLGTFALWVEATDLNGNVANAGPFSWSSSRRFTIYLPLVLRQTLRTPKSPDCYPALWLEPTVGHTPHGVAVDGVGHRLFVANHDDNTLSILSTQTYQPLGTVAVGNGPNGVAYHPGKGLVYVANGEDKSVSVVRVSDQIQIRKIPVGTEPSGVAVDVAHSLVYVANYRDGTVSVIDADTNKVARTLTVGAEPSMIAVHQGRSKAFVALHGSAALAVIDSAGQVTVVDLNSSGPYGVAVDEDRDLVYVATIDTRRIVAVDAATDNFLGWTEIQRTPGGELVPLRQIAVNPKIGSSGHLFVTTAGADGGGNQVLMLPKGWAEGLARPRALPLNEPREGIAVDPDSRLVFVPSRADDRVAVVLDGEPACATSFSAVDEYQIGRIWRPLLAGDLPLVMREHP